MDKDELQYVSLRLPKALIEYIDERAKKTESTRSQVVRMIVRQAKDEEEK